MSAKGVTKLFAMVPRGMEFLAAEEITECVELSESSIEYAGKGIVVFTALGRPTDERALTTWLSLRSVDNVFAFVGERPNGVPVNDDNGFGTTREQGLEFAEAAAAEFATDGSLDEALSVWREVGAAGKLIPKPDGSPIDFDRPKLRATGVRDGRHSFKSPEMAGWVAAGVQKAKGLEVSLKEWDVEVYIRCVDEGLWIGLSLTRRDHVDLHKRNRHALVDTTLKSSIAHCMLRLARIRPSEVVLDPMCGSGTIPVECSQFTSLSLCGGKGCSNLCIGGDIDPDAVAAARVNTRMSMPHMSGPSVVSWSATLLPLRDGCIDVIVCDMPYGRRCGSKKENIAMYGKIVAEVARVLRPRFQARALLLTWEAALMREELLKHSDTLNCVGSYTVDNSGYKVELFVVYRR